MFLGTISSQLLRKKKGNDAQDLAGNSCCVAPLTITYPTDDRPMENLQHIQGLAYPNCKVTISIDKIHCYATTGDLCGHFYIQLPSPLSVGRHTILVSSFCHCKYHYVCKNVDVIPGLQSNPPPPIILTPIPGSSSPNTLPLITGTAIPGNLVTLCILGLPCMTTITHPSGNFSLQWPTPLPDATYTLTATQTSKTGIVSPEALVVFAVLTPLPIILYPENNAVISDPTPTIIGRGYPGNTVEVCILGYGCIIVPVEADGLFSATNLTDLPDGVYTYTARQISPAGSTSGLVTQVFTIDTFNVLFQLTGTQMGPSFRTITASYNASSTTHATLEIYYLFLPVGSVAPTVDELINYDDTATLSLGIAARGTFIQSITSIVSPYTVNLTGLQIPLPQPQETGLIDGYRYVLYMVALGTPTDNSGVVTLGNNDMAMPFAGGIGTLDAPFLIERLDAAQLNDYIDLQAGHPANRAGVNETARMLDNIEGLQVLFDETSGFYGMSDSLSLVYTVMTDFDLITYGSAYSGTGWRPIGNQDTSVLLTPPSGSHIFTGVCNGTFGGVTIENTIIRRIASPTQWVQKIGLFGSIASARITLLTVLSPIYEVVASFSAIVTNNAAVGSLVGSMVDSTILTCSVLNTTIDCAVETNGGNMIYAGGLVGFVFNNASIRDITIGDATLTNNPRLTSYMGGMIGVLDQQAGNATLSNINIANITINTYLRAGGVIGSVANGLRLAEFITIASVSLNAINTAGGFAARIVSDTPCLLHDIQINDLTVNQPGSILNYAGGLLGLAAFYSGCTVYNVVIIAGILHAQSFVGGVFGQMVLRDGDTGISQIRSEILLDTTGQSVGGFVGIAISQSNHIVLFSECVRDSISEILGSFFVGGFIGSANDTTNDFPMIFASCTTNSPTRALNPSSQIGGFVGQSYQATYTNCRSRGIVTGTSFVGGFVGRCDGQTLTSFSGYTVNFIACSAGGNVTLTGAGTANVGGFGGNMLYAFVDECSALGSISGASPSFVGGFCGSTVVNFTEFHNSYAVGNINLSGGSSVGGFCGNTGGIIDRCYAGGNIATSTTVAGICGNYSTSQGGTLSRCMAINSTIAGTTAVRRIANTAQNVLSINYAISDMVAVLNSVPITINNGTTTTDGQSFLQAQMLTTLGTMGWNTANVWNTATIATIARPTLLNNPE